MIIDTASNPSSSYTFYQPYLHADEVRIGLESGQLFEGTLRINQRNYEEAFINNPDGDQFPDIMILGLQNRNRSFQDDVVVVKLNDRKQWIAKDHPAMTSISSLMHLDLTNGRTPQKRQKVYCFLSEIENDSDIPENRIIKTAKVIHIKEAKGSRTAVGFLKPTVDGKQNWAIFSPRDSRVPRMLIPVAQFPNGFAQRPQDFGKFLFVATVHKWEEKSKMAHAKLLDCLGNVGDVKAESESLLVSNKVDTREFPAELLRSLPIVKGEQWTIDEEEIAKRKDFRSFTVFTIDPATARDLDDALHIKRIQDCDGKGNLGWEIGVHIADVSHFLKSGTELDKWASQRATSVYLVERVIPMLPRILCEELCSLNPGVDRLTFSVVWKMNDKAEIQNQWIGRSVIRSCVKLAYDHAQEMIENPEKEFDETNFPTIHDGKSIDDIKSGVLNLNKVAQILKKKRVDNGSLRLDAAKLRFALKSQNGMPLAVGFEDRKEANFLVEEFMLLANISIAKFIYSKYEDTALLRRHPPPKAKIVSELGDKLGFLDCSVEFSNSKTLAESLNEYLKSDDTALYIYPTLTQFVLRSMQLALYFCSGVNDNFHHYALNVPFYTHFTSPIRRYPDVIVHRLLAGALGYSEPPNYSPEGLETICKHCNDQKIKAKAVSDASGEMFFGFFIREVGFLRTVGVVINVLDSAFDVYMVKYNLVRRVYTENLKLAKKFAFVEGTLSKLSIDWAPEHVNMSNEKRLEFIQKNARSAKKAEEYDDDLDEHEFVLDSALKEEELKTNGLTSVRQTLRAFTPLILILTPAEENAIKFNCTIEPTTDDSPLGHAEIKNILYN